MVHGRKRAMVLIVTLLISAIIALFLVSTVKLLPIMGFSATNLEQKELALAAARSGVDYVRSRIQSDPAWRGDGPGLVVDTPELKVLEDNGNIFGFITPTGGPPSHFRLRFNYQNGTASTPEDDFPDPTFLIDSPFVSYNNLRASYAREQYRATPGGAWEVTSSSPVAGTVPRFTAAIIVEGFAGPAVRDLTPATPLFSANGKKTREVVETYLVRPGFLNVDSVVMAASSLDGLLSSGGTMTVESGDSTAPPRVRTLNSMTLDASSGSANYVMDTGGEVFVDIGQDFMLNGTSSTSPTATEEASANQAPHWLNISFDEVTRAQSTGPTVRAGTYVWKNGAGGPRLEYFPEDYAGTVPSGSGTLISTGSDMLLSGAGAVNINPAQYQLTFTDNIYVEPQVSGSVTGFSVVTEPGFMSIVGKRPETLLSPAATSNVVVSNDHGSVFVEGKIEGNGAVTSVGDITFQGSSVLEADPDMAVALYAKGDINLKAIPDEVLPSLGGSAVTLSRPRRRSHHGHGSHHGHHGSGGSWGGGRWGGGGSPFPGSPFNASSDVAFSGIIYAQGDFNVDLRSQDQAGALLGGDDGSLYLVGLLATYGGDPATDSSPGQGGSGDLKLRLSDAAFVYAPEYLNALADIDSPGRLEQSFWTKL